MAAPTIAAEVVDGQTAADATSHVLDLPAGIGVGDLLVMVFGVDQDPAVTWPAGWTARAALASAGLVRGEVRVRVADGSEGATITLTTDTAQKSQSWAFRVAAAEWEGTLAGGIFAAAVAGASTTPDSPNLAPTPGSAEYLWVAGWVNDNANRTFSGTYPANYTNGAFSNLSDAFGVGLGRSRRALAAASENPGAASALSASEEWVAFTLAVHPTAGGGTTQLSLAGAIAPVGALVRKTRKFLGGLTGPGGSLTKRTRKALAGATSPAGSLRRMVAKKLGGAIAPVGQTRMLVRMRLHGAVAPAGALSLRSVVALLLGGSVSPSGALRRTTRKGLGGVIAPVGELRRLTRKRLAGAIAPAGSLARRIRIRLGGLVAPIGQLLAQLPGATGPGSVVLEDESKWTLELDDVALFAAELDDVGKWSAELDDYRP